MPVIIDELELTDTAAQAAGDAGPVASGPAPSGSGLGLTESFAVAEQRAARVLAD